MDSNVGLYAHLTGAVSYTHLDVYKRQVAAISAAVACAMDTDQPVAIKSIRKADTVTNRSVWRLAGITENTRPF